MNAVDQAGSAFDPAVKEMCVADTNDTSEMRPVESAALVGNKLKTILKSKGISQEEFSRLIGASFRQTNRIILGKSEPSLILASRMAAVLEVPVADVFNIKIKLGRARKTNSS